MAGDGQCCASTSIPTASAAAAIFRRILLFLGSLLGVHFGVLSGPQGHVSIVVRGSDPVCVLGYTMNVSGRTEPQAIR